MALSGKLDSTARERVHARMNRDATFPSHWTRPILKAACDSIDDDLDVLVVAIASGLSVSNALAARNLTERGGIYALVGIPAVRTALSDMQAAAETACGSTFAQGGGVNAALRGRRMFARVLRAVVLRRFGEYSTTEDS